MPSGSEDDAGKEKSLGDSLMYRLLIVLLTSVAAVRAIAGDIKVINDKAAFPEGPAFVDGKLIMSNMAATRSSSGTASRTPSCGRATAAARRRWCRLAVTSS